jgi:hypothetical protein
MRDKSMGNCNWIEDVRKETQQSTRFWKIILCKDFLNILIILIIVFVWVLSISLGWFKLTLENLDRLILYLLISLFIPTLTGLISYFSTYEEPLNTDFRRAFNRHLG